MTNPQSLTVELPDQQSYPIVISDKPVRVFSDSSMDFLAGRSVLLVSDETVAELYLDMVKALLVKAEVVNIASLVFAPGEQSKTLATIQDIYDTAFDHHFDREGCIVALGGGIVGDVAGFAASSLLRGVDFLQIPTTLLSQVDSSVGGKTGVNHRKGKNLIGAFKQPKAVLIATDFLQTLSSREVSAGIAEVIKYGLIADADFYDWLRVNMSALRSLEPSILTAAIRRSCALKAKIVAQDEQEDGIRAILNFGHTFGHAIERVLGYGVWLHGEAVGLGMLMALSLSVRLGYVDEDVIDGLESLLVSAGLPTLLPKDCDIDALMAAMLSDKKVKFGKQHFIVLANIGEAMIVSEPSSDMVRESVLAFQCE